MVRALVLSLLLVSIIPSAAYSNDTMDINLSVEVLRFDGVEPRTNSFELTCYMLLEWENRLNETIPEGSRYVEVCDKLLWQPEIIVANKLEDLQDPITACYVRNNTVQLHARMDLRLQTNFELRAFPVDRQEFDLSFESKVHDINVVQFNRLTFQYGMQRSGSNGEWVIMGDETSTEDFRYEIYSRTTHRAHMRLNVRRDPDYWLLQFCIPVLVLETITWWGLYLPTDAAMPRLMLCIIAMLTILTLRGSVAQQLPRVSYLTYFDVYLLLGVMLCALSLIWNLVVLYMKKKARVAETELANTLGRLILPLLSVGYFVILFAVALIPPHRYWVAPVLGPLGAGFLLFLNKGLFKKHRRITAEMGGSVLVSAAKQLISQKKGLRMDKSDKTHMLAGQTPELSKYLGQEASTQGGGMWDDESDSEAAEARRYQHIITQRMRSRVQGHDHGNGAPSFGAC